MGNIKYKLAKFKNSNSDFNNYFYPRAVSIGTLTTEEIADRIQQNCSLKKSDVIACLAELSEQMHQALTSSMSVRLDGIGIFSVGIKTKEMVEDVKDFSPREHIAGYRLNFLPSYNVQTNGRRSTKLLAGAGVTEYQEYAEGVNQTKKVNGKYVKIELQEKA